MPITRKLVAHSNNEDMQLLKIDNSTRYIENHSQDWQFLFGPNSAFTTSQQVVKIAAEFDKVNFDSIYFSAYLYNNITGNVDNAASCQFIFYKIDNPLWTETTIYTVTGSLLSNQHFYVDTLLTSLPGIDFLGGDVFLIEAVITRLGVVYRDRVYINHLGVYDSIFRLKQDVEFLDISKVDE